MKRRSVAFKSSWTTWPKGMRDVIRWKHAALLAMIGRMGVVTLFCNLTAAIGFGVFALTRSAILQQFGLFWLQLTMGNAMGAAGEAPRELGAAMLLLQVVGGVLTVLQVGVCAFMIWKLTTPAIRAEFGT